MERGKEIMEILRFWFGDGSDPAHERRWFAQDAAFDESCRSGFLADHERAATGQLESWKETPSGALALILLTLIVRDDLVLLPVYQSVMAEGVKDGLAGFAANINCSSNCWNMRDWYWAG